MKNKKQLPVKEWETLDKQYRLVENRDNFQKEIYSYVPIEVFLNRKTGEIRLFSSNMVNGVGKNAVIDYLSGKE